MVQKIIQLIHREIRSIHHAAYALGLFALSSQFLALIRDRLLAYTFGADRVLDVYYAAFRIPDLLFLTVASIVSISVLIPFFVDRLEKSEEKGKEFLDSVFSFFFVAIILVCGVAFLVMPYIVPVLFPGFSGSDTEMVVSLSRLLLLSPVLLGISNLLATVTQVYQRFVLHALSPLVYNLGIIGGVVFLAPQHGVYGVVYGVLVGALLHLLIQVPFILSRGFMPRFRLAWDWPLIRKIVINSAPRRITLSIHNIAIVFLISFASLMSAGSIAIFQFSFNLQSVSLSVIGASYSVAAFPALTRMFSRGDMTQFFGQITSAARHIIFWSLPLAALFIVLRAQIVRVVLGTNKFDWTDTRLTAAALALFSLSIVFQGLMLLFVRGYFAAGNTRTPFLINTASGVLIVCFAAGLWYLFQMSPAFAGLIEHLLRVEGLQGTAALMLPLGYTLGFFVNGALLWIFFQRDFGRRLYEPLRALWQSLIAAVLAGVGAYLSLNVFDDIFAIDTLPGIFLQGFASGIIGALVGGGVLILLGNRELREMWDAVKQRIWRTHVVAPDNDSIEG